MAVNVKRLRYFCAVAEDLHFGRAAKRLHMAQPPLSQQIRILESELGFDLFERTTRRVALTDKGRQLYPEADRLCREADLFTRRATEIRTGEGGVLRLGFVDSASYNLMPGFLQAYRSRWPAVDYELRSMSSDEQLDALSRGTIDLGLCRTAFSGEGTEATVIACERLVIATSTANPLADADSVTLDQLQDQVFIGFDRLVSPSLHRELTALLASRSIPYDPIIEATEYATILGLVASGQGVALVPASVQTFNPPTLSFVPVDDHDAVTSLLLLRRRGERSVVVRRAVELATELFDLPS